MIREIQLEQIQAAVFSNSINMTDKLAIAKALQERIQVLDGEPLVLPIKDAEAPPEVPRILLKSGNGKYSLNLARSRLDFFFKPDENNLEKALTEDMVIFKQVLNAYKEALSPAINRLGLIIKQICLLEESSNSLMLHKFIQTGRFESTHQIQLNVLDRLRLGSIETNRWIKIHSLRNKSNPQDDKAISLELDINTLQETHQLFSTDTIIAFFGDAGNHCITISEQLVSALQ